MHDNILHQYNNIPSNLNSKLYSPREITLFEEQTCQHQYATIEMHEWFKDEFDREQAYACQQFEKEEDDPSKYFNSEDRAQHEVSFDGCGRIIDKEGRKLHGFHIYIELPDHRIIAAPSIAVSNHSHLSAGMPVLSAGFMMCDSGVVITLSNNSGHYKPHRDSIRHHLTKMLKQTQNSKLIFEDHTDMSKANGRVQYIEVSSFLEGSDHWLTEQGLKDHVHDSLKTNLNRVFSHDEQEKKLVQAVSKLKIGTFDANALLSACYAYDEQTTEAELLKQEDDYKKSLVECYTMTRAQSRYARSASLSEVKPNSPTRRRKRIPSFKQ